VTAPPIRRCSITVLVVVLLAGCSRYDIRSTGYETLESMRLQQCMDKIDSDCSMDRIRYDDYQAERERLQDRHP